MLITTYFFNSSISGLDGKTILIPRYLLKKGINALNRITTTMIPATDTGLINHRYTYSRHRLAMHNTSQLCFVSFARVDYWFLDDNFRRIWNRSKMQIIVLVHFDFVKICSLSCVYSNTHIRHPIAYLLWPDHRLRSSRYTGRLQLAVDPLYLTWWTALRKIFHLRVKDYPANRKRARM